MQEKMITELAEKALAARDYSYVPYSGFAVGAALLAKNGTVYTGCNIENAAFTPTNCAERTAVFKAVSEGVREFAAIAVAGGKKGEMPEDYCSPCGVCRQVLSEFCDPTLDVYLVRDVDDVRHVQLGDLLPYAFDSFKAEDM